MSSSCSDNVVWVSILGVSILEMGAGRMGRPWNASWRCLRPSHQPPHHHPVTVSEQTLSQPPSNQQQPVSTVTVHTIVAKRKMPSQRGNEFLPQCQHSSNISISVAQHPKKTCNNAPNPNTNNPALMLSSLTFQQWVKGTGLEWTTVVLNLPPPTAILTPPTSNSSLQPSQAVKFLGTYLTPSTM